MGRMADEMRKGFGSGRRGLEVEKEDEEDDDEKK